MRSLVLGGSGIVGGYIIDRLLEQGERPIAVSRQSRESDKVDWLVGDLSSRENHLRMSDVSTIYCTVHVGLLAEALPRIATPALKRVVVFTSTSLETKQASELEIEREMVRAWASAERKFIDTAVALGVGWTVLRPTLIYAEGRDGNVSRIARLVERLGFMPIVGAGLGLRQPVHAEDLAIGAVAAAKCDAANDRTYVLPGGDTIPYREMVERIFDGLGRPRRIVCVPAALWRLAFLFIGPFLKDANVAMAIRMTKDMAFDGSAAIADFQWSPRPFRPVFPGVDREMMTRPISMPH